MDGLQISWDARTKAYELCDELNKEIVKISKETNELQSLSNQYRFKVKDENNRTIRVDESPESIKAWALGCLNEKEVLLLRINHLEVQSQADISWANSVQKEKGSIPMNFITDSLCTQEECHLETGEVFKRKIAHG